MSIWEVIAYTCFTVAAIDAVFMIILVYRHREEIKRGLGRKQNKGRIKR